MIVEMHCHTSQNSPCSHVGAVELLRRAHEMDIQTVVITDHHYQWSEDELADLRRQAGLPDIFCVLTGQEVGTRDFGHVLVYGASETIERQKITVGEIREQNPDAAVIWAHPYRDGRIPDRERLLDPLIDGIEIFSSNYAISEAMRALNDWHRYKFTAIAGTDTHAYSYAGTYPTIFDHPFDSIEGMVAEIKAGRCHPYFKEVPRTGTSKTNVKEVTVGPKSAQKRTKMIVKSFADIDAWKAGERTHQIARTLCQHGFDRGRYRVPRPMSKDPDTLSLAEQRIKGKSLFDAVVQADDDGKRKYLQEAALWLAKLHNANLEITPKDEYKGLEPDRLRYYLSSLVETEHPHLERVRQILNRVLEQEMALLDSRPDILAQGHGDYHAKNIFVACDAPEQEEYIAAIDFASSYQMPRAYDVGTFLAQYINMFFDHHDVQRAAPSEIFIDTYLAHAKELEEHFVLHVNLYKARTCLSILYFLTKVGMGDSENFWRVLVEAEKCLASLAVRQHR
mgnify:CR=1 FL=1